jgi:excisionase family DNA binding protein
VPAPDGQYLTVAQAAVDLGVSPRRVRALVSAGWLRAKHVNPRLILIRRSNLKYVSVRSPGRPRK